MNSSAKYPHTLRASGVPLLTSVVGCLMLVALMVWLILVTLGAEASGAWILTIFSVVWLAIGVYAAWEVSVLLTRRTVFDASCVTVESMWGRRCFERSLLHGWRWGVEHAGLLTVELYEVSRTRPFLVWVSKKPDQTVMEWFGDSADLTLKDKVAALGEVERDQNFGHTSEERIENVDAEQRLIRRITWALVALLMWVLIYPRPYRVAVGAAIVAPILVIIATFMRRDRWQLQRGTTDFRPSTGSWITLCALCLFLRAFYDWRLLDMIEPAVWAVAVGLVLTVVVSVIFGEPLDDRGRVANWAIVASLYAYGVILPLNMWIDSNPPTTYQASVTELRAESTVLAAPPPFQRTLDIEIATSLGERLVVGGAACLYLYRGALGIRSYDVDACET